MEHSSGSNSARRRLSAPRVQMESTMNDGDFVMPSEPEKQKFLPKENSEYQELETEPASPGRIHKNISIFPAFNWIAILSIAGFSLLTIIAWHGLTTNYALWPLEEFLSSNGSYNTTDGETEKISEILLHPGDHVNRESKVQTFHWRITVGYRWPDGVKKRVYLINDQFPGPIIETRSGDTLIIEVENALDVSAAGEGLSIHWHGLYMRKANHMDGAEGFTQCSIPAGGNFTYEFKIDDSQYGTFWYHAHSQVQRGDGLYGGLIVHRPVGEAGMTEMKKYEYAKEVLWLVGDWYHRSAEEILSWYTSVRAFGNEPVPDSMIINGAGHFNCDMAVPARPVECNNTSVDSMQALLPGDLVTTRIRVVNVGSLAGMTLRVPNAKLTPIQIDGGCEIAGRLTDSIGILYPGERVDFVMEMDRRMRNVSPQLEIYLDPENFNYPNPTLTANQSFPLLSLSSRKQSIQSPPTDIGSDILPGFDLQTATSMDKAPIPDSEDLQHKLIIYTKTVKLAKYSYHPMGMINHTFWVPQAQPLLSLPRSEWNSNQFVPFLPVSPNNQPTWIDITINNLDDGSHPFHLHGHDFYVLASHRADIGWGSYNPYSTEAWNPKPNFNFHNPLRKDTISVPRHGFAIIRVKADNPGLWMLHCHVLVHQASGMAMGVQFGEAGDEEHVTSIDSRAGSLCQM